MTDSAQLNKQSIEPDDVALEDDIVALTDQRDNERHEIATEGQIKLGNGFKIPVRVLDMSHSGARLRLSQFVILPNEFDLEIFSPDRRKLKITTSSRQWQRQGVCGVKFLRSRTELLPDGAF